MTPENQKSKDLRRFAAAIEEEKNAVALYSGLADVEKNPKLAEVYRRLAAAEQKHVKNFEKRLESVGGTVNTFRPSWRTKMLLWIAKRGGPQLVLPTVMAMERMNTNDYSGEDDSKTRGMMADEQSHARLIKHISLSGKGGLEGGALARIEGRHRGTGGNALRAAVLGANDGLVSNLSLIMGVAGASLSNSTILVTGMAGLLAGACSMALGEWLSVQSSRELYEHQIRAEADEIEASPKEEAEELALIYQAKGLGEMQARTLADQIMSDPDKALDTLVREELGIDPKELGGSAWQAAITSFCLFAIGAIVPLSSFFAFQASHAVLLSVLCSAVALFAIGAGTTLFTGRSVLFSGSRQVVFGLAAAGITYGIGSLIGIHIH